MENNTLESPDTKAVKPAVDTHWEERQQRIAEIASHVYEVREGKEGTPEEDWLKAEAILERLDRAAATEQPLVTHTEDLPKTLGEVAWPNS